MLKSTTFCYIVYEEAFFGNASLGKLHDLLGYNHYVI